MKPIYFYLKLASLIAVSSQLSATTHEIMYLNPCKMCAEHIDWLLYTVNTSLLLEGKRIKVEDKRIDVARSLSNIVEDSAPFQINKEVVDNLDILLQREKSYEVVQYLAGIVEGLRIKELASTLCSILYKYYDYGTTKGILKALKTIKGIKPSQMISLVAHAAKNDFIYCSCEEIWELPYYLKCETKTLEGLVTMLAYERESISVEAREQLVDAISYIKDREFVTDVKEEPYFTNKAIKAFCYLFERDPGIINSSIVRLFRHTYSLKLFKTLTHLIEENQVTDLWAREAMIEWLGSRVDRFGMRKKSNAILLKEVQNQETTIRITAIKELKKEAFTPELTNLLLAQLVRNRTNTQERKAVVTALKRYSPLLKYGGATLFYDSVASKKMIEKYNDNIFFYKDTLYNKMLVKRKKYRELRKKMIHAFRVVLNSIEMYYTGPYGFKVRNEEADDLIELLVYLKDEDINDALWDYLQSQYREWDKVKITYLRLYERAPFFLLKLSSQQKLIHLYIKQFGLFLHNLFFSDLPGIIFRYLFLDVVGQRLPYESLPVIYTGQKKGINQRYASSTCLKIFD